MLREILLDHFARKKIKNESYSVRAFSQRLGVNHSALSEIMNGRRKVGLKLGQRLADSLMLDADVRNQLFADARSSSRRKKEKPTARLFVDQYRVIADWFHFAILSLAETEDFESDAEWIARRLGITKSQAKEAVDRLCRLEMLIEERGKWRATGKSFTSPDGVVDAAVRLTHHQYLEMALRSLEHNDVDARDFTAITMAVDPKKLPEAKRRIREFRDSLCTFLESGSKKEVFELCLQLFPLSKGDGR